MSIFTVSHPTSIPEYEPAGRIKQFLLVRGFSVDDVAVDHAHATIVCTCTTDPSAALAQYVTTYMPEEVAPQPIDLGSDATGVAPMPGGRGINGWLSSIRDAAVSIYTLMTGALTGGGAVRTVVESMPSLSVTSSGSTSVTNFPSSQPVTGTFWPTTQPVSGSIAVSNLPSVQPVSGSVSVSNQPSSLAVSNFPVTQPISGSVGITNLPATQAVSGTVGVNNFPASQAVTGTFWQATQPISGSVSVANFPTTQVVSGSLTITPPSPGISVPFTSLSIATKTAVWTPATGKKWHIRGLALSVSVAGSVSFYDGANASPVFTTPALVVGNPFVADFGDEGLESAAANNTLRIQGPALTVANGSVWGREA